MTPDATDRATRLTMPRRCRHATRSTTLLLALALLLSPCSSFTDEALGWTDRLGLTFTDECQEHKGLIAVFHWLGNFFSGNTQKVASGHCETREVACPPGLTVTGLGVKSGHLRRGGSRELYDFRLACGRPAQLTDWLGLRFDLGSSPEEQGAGVCPDKAAAAEQQAADGEDAAVSDVTGVQVARGRSDTRDYYHFKLRCGKLWREVVGLPFERLRETRSATCPRHTYVTGVRVHRGFQDWGSLDTYEFQLKCHDLETIEQMRMENAAAGFGLSLSDILAMGDDAWNLLSSYIGGGGSVPAEGQQAGRKIPSPASQKAAPGRAAGAFKSREEFFREL